MTETNASGAMHTEVVIARWHLTLARFADNDNEPRGMRAAAMVAVVGLPLASTAALAACLRFLL
ncbi:hypothetical protein [Methylobacterium sp. J-068]|uniref:hypothetical protein n=1 Tax=Methylobacterium sp. J-068 TaxID=2836649 RepID=UPI001FB942DD|nr:hypothetical protein [Methylobacterium sp. J-068]MCJ2035542.1 hypothetical protein [Methylobacterium sp. J-068]